MKESREKPDIDQLNLEETIYKLITTASNLGMPFALYRLPGQKDTYTFLVSFSPVIALKDEVLEEFEEGFIFAKFQGERFFLKADITWNTEDTDLTIRKTLETDPRLDQFMEKLNSGSDSKVQLARNSAGDSEKTDEKFLDLVNKAIDHIDDRDFEKVVPARAHLIEDFDETKCIPFFNKLASNYKNAFVSLFSSPDTGSWMGATPELLVQTKENRYFRTVSLAGTQTDKGQDLKSVAWTQKEIEEQAIVSRYIINCFKKIRLREFEESGPKTVLAGNLIHLITHFSVDMEETNFPQLGSVMLDLLHPTSAVCGMPLESSLNFLKNNEELDRRFYSGYLGPVNSKDGTDIFVNLRCLEFTDKGAKLYAGAGVTIDSDPDKELEETESKFDTLRKIISQV